MGKQQHNFVTFTNPRNGKVRIKACASCGLAKGLEVAVRHCNATATHEHKMLAAGWQQASDPSRVASRVVSRMASRMAVGA